MRGYGPPTSLHIAGGSDAPRVARLAVLSALDGRLSEAVAGDIGLLVSELVTNSVRHAGVGADDTVVVEVLLARDRVRIAVVDHGSERMPRVADRAPDEPGGLGLRLVERLSATWGVARDSDGVTRVWCELPLGSRSADGKGS